MQTPLRKALVRPGFSALDVGYNDVAVNVVDNAPCLQSLSSKPEQHEESIHILRHKNTSMGGTFSRSWRKFENNTQRSDMAEGKMFRCTGVHKVYSLPDLNRIVVKDLRSSSNFSESDEAL
uniref:Uncharacterized protein n=1 Tax=Knipowitschia caucasica TaxID=637954 RepID=A0AAV2K921_KNICA